jgi:integrase
VNLPRWIETEKRFLSVEELHELADTIDPRYRTLVLTAGYTGARFGELAALRHRDLDLGRRRDDPSRSPRLSSTTLLPASTNTPQAALTGCSPHPKEDPSDAAASGNDSGSRPWTHPSANPCGSTT